MEEGRYEETILILKDAALLHIDENEIIDRTTDVYLQWSDSKLNGNNLIEALEVLEQASEEYANTKISSRLDYIKEHTFLSSIYKDYEGFYWERQDLDPEGNKTYYEDSEGLKIVRGYDEKHNLLYFRRKEMMVSKVIRKQSVLVLFLCCLLLSSCGRSENSIGSNNNVYMEDKDSHLNEENQNSYQESESTTETINEDSIEIINELYKYNDEGYVLFGYYDQDGDTTNGLEPIEWEILEDNDKDFLLISRYVLESEIYNELVFDEAGNSQGITWEECYLRKWLNNEFYNKAFSDQEKKFIKTSHVINDVTGSMGLGYGHNTEDNVYILCVAEIEKYYDFNYEDSDIGIEYSQELMSVATEHALQGGVFTERIFDATFEGYDDYVGLKAYGYTSDCIGMGEVALWWTRTSSFGSFTSVVPVSTLGGIWYTEGLTTDNTEGVRPVIRIRK